jgi:RNA polymerase sigma factor (sigma-70 family)
MELDALLERKSGRMTDSTVYIVDDDALVRRSLERLVLSVGRRVKTFSTAQEFLDCQRPDGPACIVLDVRMPGLSGLDLQEKLSVSGLDMPVIFVTGHGTVPMSVRAMKAGAIDFLQKPFDDQVLLDAIQLAIDKDRQDREKRAGHQELERRLDSLTPREREVFALVVRGLLNKQIAGELGTSEKTIKVHRARVMQKMQADSLADLVRMGMNLAIRS